MPIFVIDLKTSTQRNERRLRPGDICVLNDHDARAIENRVPVIMASFHPAAQLFALKILRTFPSSSAIFLCPLLNCPFDKVMEAEQLVANIIASLPMAVEPTAIKILIPFPHDTNNVVLI